MPNGEEQQEQGPSIGQEVASKVAKGLLKKAVLPQLLAGCGVSAVILFIVLIFVGVVALVFINPEESPATPQTTEPPTAYSEKCAIQVPLFKQSDPHWGNVSYGCGGTTISSSGCGPTSAAMVLSFYGFGVTPADMAKHSLENGGRVCGNGTSHAWFKKLAEDYKMEFEQELSWDKILGYLNKGVPVIVSGQGPEPFTNTNSSHYVVLVCRGIDDNDNPIIYVNDPARMHIDYTKAYPEKLIKDRYRSSRVLYKM